MKGILSSPKQFRFAVHPFDGTSTTFDPTHGFNLGSPSAYSSTAIGSYTLFRLDPVAFAARTLQR